MDAIATLELLKISPDGERTPVNVHVGRPCRDEGGFWTCPVEISNININAADIAGDDSMQALCLGLRFAREMLHLVIERGSRLVDPQEGKEDFPFEAYFGTNEQRSDSRP